MKLSVNGVILVLQGVYYVPELINNLMSVGQLQQKGLSVLFKEDQCNIFHGERGCFCKQE